MRKDTTTLVLLVSLLSFVSNGKELGTEEQILGSVADPPADAQVLDRIIAIVNDGIILQSELDSEVELVTGQLSERGQSPPAPELLAKQVLERLVLQEAQLQKARELGISIEDAELNRTLNNIAKNNQMSLEEFRTALISEGYSYKKFRNDIRRELIMTRLRNRQVNDHIVVSDQEIEDYLASEERTISKEKQYHLRQIFIAVPEGSSANTIREAQMRAEAIRKPLLAGEDFAELAVRVSEGQRALDGGDLGWRNISQLPSQFVEVLKNLQPGEISDPIRSPIGFHILKLEEVRGEEHHIVHRTKARHILSKVTLVRTDDEARRILKALRNRILNGEQFAELASSYSDDAVTAMDGGLLGWYSPGAMGQEFERVADSLPINELSEPFKTSLGWHIVQVIDRRREDDTAEYRKAKARELLRKRKADVETELWLRRLRDEAYVEYRWQE